MSGWNDWGLKRKLFAIILFILIVNIVVLLFMGSTLFERFYIGNKQTELQRSAEKSVKPMNRAAPISMMKLN